MTGPNPARIGACPECGSYRADGRPPYLHDDGCTLGDDLQLDRWLDEQRRGDHGGPAIPADQICPACGQPITRRDDLSWWACACRTWVTDEQIARHAEPVLRADFWHADGTRCDHGYPPGTEPPLTPDGQYVRAPQPTEPLVCAGGLAVAWYRITAAAPGPPAQPEVLTLDRPPPGWTTLGTTSDGAVLYTAPPGTPWPPDEPP